MNVQEAGGTMDCATRQVEHLPFKRCVPGDFEGDVPLYMIQWIQQAYKIQIL